MKKKNITKKFLVFILIIISIFLVLNNILKNISIAVSTGDKVTVSALWKKCSGYDVYCVQSGMNFHENKEYKVVTKKEVNSSNISSASGNDRKIAYILAYNNGNDTALTEDEMTTIATEAGLDVTSDGIRRPIFHMLYDVTSIKNNAIWEIVNGSMKWNEQKEVVQEWDLGGATPNDPFIMGKIGDRYKYLSDSFGHDHIDFSGIGNISLENNSGGEGYCEEAGKLADKAEIFATSISGYTEGITQVETTPTTDYSSDSTYIYVGPYKINYGSNVTIDKVTVNTNKGDVDVTNNVVDSSINLTEADKTTVITKPVSGEEFYIRVEKNKGITQIKINISAKQTQINATWYELVCESVANQQNLIMGKGEMVDVNISKDIVVVPGEPPSTPVNLIPPVQVIINKVDLKGNGLDNKATFKIEYSNGFTSETQTVSSTGEIIFSKIIPTSEDSFTATITEISVAKGYKKSNEIKLNFEFDSENWKITTTSTDGVDLTLDDASGESKATLKIKNQPIIDKITLVKKDLVNGEFLAEVKFNLEITSGNAKFLMMDGSESSGTFLSNVTTNEQGEILLGALLIENLENDIKIEITETSTIMGYLKLEAPIILTITNVTEGIIDPENKDIKYKATLDYQNDKYQVKDIDIDEDNELKIEIENIPIMNLGGIAWLDILNAEKEGATGNKTFDKGEGLPGINVKLYKDSVSPENLVTKNAYGEELVKETGTEGKIIQYTSYVGGDKKEYKYTNDGEYIFPSVERADYIVVFEYNGMKYQAVTQCTKSELYENTNPDKSKVTEITNRDVDFNSFKNISGLDKFSSLKGDKTFGKASKDINFGAIGFDLDMFLRYENKFKNGKDDTDGYNAINTGLFNSIIETNQDIKTFFAELFDGLNEDTRDFIINIVEEIIQKGEEFETLRSVLEFFGINQETINKINDFFNDNAIKNKLIPEEVNLVAQSTLYNFTTTDEKTETETSQEKCYNSDWSKTWNSDGTINNSSYALDINCGIEERNLDLSIATDVEDATVEINGKSTTYSYDKILDDGGINFGEYQTDKKAEDYNLYLYDSDYNYRISNYVDDPNNSNDTIINNVNKEDNAKINEAINNNTINTNDELQVYVRYKIVVNNQSSSLAQVTEIEDRFDNDIYEFVKATDKNGNLLVVVNTKDAEKGRIIIGDNALSTDLVGNSKSNTIYVIFKVKDIDNCNNAKNHVEITKYHTETGLIDQDSAPGNAFDFDNVENHEPIHYEDDTDTANGITITIKTDNPREISGYVWDDGKFIDADGKIINSEPKVNDVIVQLIEIKDVKINGKTYQFEYIWQEMQSGQNTVKKLKSDGTNIDTVDSGVTEDGRYKFTGFIPGNYIVRFIYGDGTTESYGLGKTTVDDTITKYCVQKYNGKDYKSTKDPYYYEEWYNTKIYSYNKGEKTTDSVARDNEARRLKVMSYTTKVDSAKQEKLNLLEQPYSTVDEDRLKDVLDETWMCAETSKINVSVDTENYVSKDAKQTIKNKDAETIAENEDAEAIAEKISNLDNKLKNISNQFTNINFGLALRPIMELSLKKHITNLTLTSNDASATPIVDAKVKIDNKGNIEKNSGKYEIEGLRDGLTISESTRDNRGFWKIETDLEELAQGAQLQVIYNYIVEAGGDIEYISKILSDAYNEINNNGSTTLNGNSYTSYEELLKELELFVKSQIQQKTFDKGTYLGEWYYTRDKEDAKQDTPISVTVTGIEEALNNDLSPVANILEDTSFEVLDTNKNVDRTIWKSIPEEGIKKIDDMYHVYNGKEYDDYKINNVATNKTPTKTLIPKGAEDEDTYDNIDSSKNIVLSTTLNSNAEGVNIPSYIAQITAYNTLGGVIENTIPNNLRYVHSDDTGMTLDNTYISTDGTTLYKKENNQWMRNTNGKWENIEEEPAGVINYNEKDEFWGESIIITKPTGSDKITTVQLIAIISASVAVVATGIILIKKFVITKNV